MSDVGIIPDGMMAFLFAVPLCLLLLLATAISFLYERRARRRAGASGRSLSPNLFGVSLSFAAALLVLLTLILANNYVLPRTLNEWMDDSIWLWVAAVLLLWPLGAYLRKRCRRRTL